ncbi:TPA: hypothetical protein DGH83_01820 [Candidatus Peregrinibacteria bacterium]|nr:hypothetical protein [Candidatus Peregrinibacteria bacterium]
MHIYKDSKAKFLAKKSIPDFGKKIICASFVYEGKVFFYGEYVILGTLYFFKILKYVSYSSANLRARHWHGAEK